MNSRPTVKLPDCPAWCHGHTEGDDFCTSEVVVVGGYIVDAGAWIFRYPDRPVPQIHIDCNPSSPDLTADQAREFAAGLVRLAAMIDGG